MNSLNGFFNFNPGQAANEIEIKSEKKNKSVKSNFFEISLKDIEGDIFFDKGNQIIIGYRGMINDYTPPLLVDLYLKKGKEFLKDIRGFFSLVLVNLQNKEVLLASDQIGQLRLYYSFKNNNLYFSTNISDLKTSGDYCKEGLIQIFFINYYVDDLTIFNGIKRVLPGTAIIFSESKYFPYNYFNLHSHLLNIADANYNVSIEEVADTLKNNMRKYISNDGIISTLTSGYDSRLILAALLANNYNIKAFTFGKRDNLEFQLSEEIVRNNKNIIYRKIELEKDFEDFLIRYFDFISQTKNIELNFNRFHYIYAWNEIKKLWPKYNIVTGICGDAFTRIVNRISLQTNDLFHKLINTSNKSQTINDYLSSKSLIMDKLCLKKGDTFEYLTFIFTKLKENDSFFNHTYLKVNFGVTNYFGVELNAENYISPTYPIFLELNFLESLIKSGFSIFNPNHFKNPKYFKLKSHKYYYKSIKYLCNDLNSYKTNRGFPLRYTSSVMYLPLRLALYYKHRRRKFTSDLDYNNWQRLLKLNQNHDISFNDAVKIKALQSF